MLHRCGAARRHDRATHTLAEPIARPAQVPTAEPYGQRTTSYAVLYVAFGGPRSLDDLRPFLINLFQDERIIPVKWWCVRRAIAEFIVCTRLSNSRTNYEEIGACLHATGPSESHLRTPQPPLDGRWPQPAVGRDRDHEEGDVSAPRQHPLQGGLRVAI